MSTAELDRFDRQKMTLQGDFLIGDVPLGPKRVIEIIAPLLTEDRRHRIDTVLQKRCSRFRLVMENLYDRGNVSAVLRSAESFGYYACHLIEKPNSKFKASARVSKGAEKWMHIEKFESPLASVNSLRAQGFQVFATHLQASQPIHEIDFSKPTAFVLGNEKEGVSDDMLKICDGNVVIPMVGFSQSFNISVAAAICCYHVFEEHRRSAQTATPDADELLYLKANYYLRCLDSPEKWVGALNSSC